MPADDADDLFRLPPAEFIAARDALAKRLKAEGAVKRSAEVKALRRPTVGAWAVNQVALDHPELVEAVVDAGTAVREAQEELLGGGDRDALKEATAARRKAVAAAAKAAAELAGAAHREAITATFDAAAADEDAADKVRSGRLTKELAAPSGFGMLHAVPDRPDEEGEDEVDTAAIEAAQARLAEATAAAEEARTAADEAEARRAELAEQLAAAEAEAEEAQAAADAADAEAAEARQALDDLT